MFQKYNIKSIVDFVQDPKFYDINHDKWKFTEFHKTKKLPKPFEGMRAGIFEAHRIIVKDDIKNIHQYISKEPPEELKQLQLDIESAIRDFRWE